MPEKPLRVSMVSFIWAEILRAYSNPSLSHSSGSVIVSWVDPKRMKPPNPSGTIISGAQIPPASLPSAAPWLGINCALGLKTNWTPRSWSQLLPTLFQ